jgi:hypothetical protein
MSSNICKSEGISSRVGKPVCQLNRVRLAMTGMGDGTANHHVTQTVHGEVDRLASTLQLTEGDIAEVAPPRCRSSINFTG